MAELKARTPCGDSLPISLGGVTLSEIDPGHLTLLTLLGDAADLDTALQAAHGVTFPKPNRMQSKGGVKCAWFGRNQALLMGPAAQEDIARHAALVDQSDGWCTLTLNGAGAADVLARLVPVDLRADRFKRGHSLRTQLGHMNASITRTGTEGFMILVFRSMASTLVHELERAMRGVASRSSLASRA